MYLQHSNQCLIYFPGPDFVTSVEDGDYVYFFFREQAVEYINCGKVNNNFLFVFMVLTKSFLITLA